MFPHKAQKQSCLEAGSHVSGFPLSLGSSAPGALVSLCVTLPGPRPTAHGAGEGQPGEGRWLGQRPRLLPACGVQAQGALHLGVGGTETHRKSNLALEQTSSLHQSFIFNSRDPASQGHTVKPGDVLGCHDLGVLGGCCWAHVGSGQRPGMLLTVLHHAGRPRQNRSGPDVHGAGGTSLGWRGLALWSPAG